MALKDMQADNTLSASAPAFETEDEIMTAPAAETTAVAPVAATAVAAPSAAKFKMAFADLQNAFPEDAVVGLSLAVPRIKAEQGSAYIADKSLGEKFKIEVESWNHRTLVSAGLDSKDPGYQESMEYLRTSYDGKTIHGDGQTIDEYIEFLKSLSYTKARSSKYIDLFGFLTWTAKDGAVDPEKRELCLVQLSQTSAGNFAAFCTTQGLLQSKGLSKGGSNVIEIQAVARSKGAMKYSNFAFAAAK